MPSRLPPPAIALVSLGLCFFGSLILAACFYPHPYIWWETVMSSLASPRDNPQAYGIASAGLALSGLLLIPFKTYLHQRLGPLSPRTIIWAGRLFLLGAIFLTLTALLVPGHYRILGIGRTHEHLAQIAGVAFCLALILYLSAVFHLPRTFLWLRLTALIFAAAPTAALILSRLSLLITYDFFSKSVYQAAKLSLWNSLALWEWIGAIGIYLFLGVVTLGVPPRTPRT